MGHFEGEISQAVVLALFIPLIISSGGNSGSQASSIIIRAMALGEIKFQGLVVRHAQRNIFRPGVGFDSRVCRIHADFLYGSIFIFIIMGNIGNWLALLLAFPCWV